MRVGETWRVKEEVARMKKCVAKRPLGRGSQPFVSLFRP